MKPCIEEELRLSSYFQPFLLESPPEKNEKSEATVLETLSSTIPQPALFEAAKNEPEPQSWLVLRQFYAVLAMWSVVKPLSHSISSWLVDQDSQFQWPFQEPKMEVPTIYKA